MLVVKVGVPGVLVGVPGPDGLYVIEPDMETVRERLIVPLAVVDMLRVGVTVTV
jgi:hypothetical protein